MTATPSRANAGSPTRPGPCPELRGSPPIAALGVGDAASTVTVPVSHATAARRPPTSAGRALTSTAPTSAQARPALTSARPPAREATASAGRRDSPAGQDSHRLRPFQRGQDERPAEAGRHRRRPAGSRVGTPTTIACSTDETWSIRSRAGVAVGVPAGTRSVMSAAVPSDSRTTTTSPPSSAESSTAMASRPSWISNGTRSRRSSRSVQPRGPRSWRRVRRNTSGRCAASSKSVSRVDPALDRHVARPTGGEGPGLADADHRRGCQEPPHPVARAVCPQHQDPDRQRDEARRSGARAVTRRR